MGMPRLSAGQAMTVPIKPLPCPVCGRTPKVDRYKFVAGEWRADCSGQTKKADHWITADGKDAEDAIKRWNRYVGRKK
jgi:hypothetical protein